MTVPHLNGQSETAESADQPLAELLAAERTTTIRLRSELTALRSEYERAAAAETALLLELGRVKREAEDRAVRLLLAEELLADRNRSDATP